MDKHTYKKHIYWFDPEDEKELREELAAKGIKLKSAKGIVCAPLDRVSSITSVAPNVWNETCKRQGSWYRASDKKGLYLVVSPFELGGHDHEKAGVIEGSDFSPPRLATWEQKKELAKDREFKARMPEEWGHVGETEKRIYLRWSRRMGSSEDNYDNLFLSHTANHANFVSPRFFIKEDGQIIPYSIDRSAYLCSCCVELFQVLAGDYKKKLVAPCPGACIFARLKPDRYLLVEKR